MELTANHAVSDATFDRAKAMLGEQQVIDLTVLSGTILLAMGHRADEAKLKAYGAGDYLYMPATKPHFGGARGATVIQLHGQGPFAINLASRK